MAMTWRRGGAILLFMTLAAAAMAQQAVPVGKGSYAAAPPAGVARGKAEETERAPLYLVKEDGRPIPSNKWYQKLILSPFATGLWPYPHKVNTNAKGLEIFFPTRWNADGGSMALEQPLRAGGADFTPADARAKTWSDWTVTFRMAESAEKYVDVTLGEGMPCIWLEYRGVRPTLAWGEPGRKQSPARLFSLDGKDLALPFSGDALGLEWNGRAFGIFAPDGTRFEAEDAGLTARFAGPQQFLVICPMPTAADLKLFHQYAYAVPRDTRLGWRYDRAAGTIATTWQVETEPLKGSERRVIQGWLPHHTRTSRNNLALLPVEYMTGRGRMQCAAGNTFTLTYDFSGILPNLPSPKAGGEPAHAFDQARMGEMLAGFAERKGFPSDTYAAGKFLVRQLQAATIARQMQDPHFAAILQSARAELQNWLTYTPGEKGHFFAYYPHRKGLVGFDSSFGSEHFTDHHFHYGYFTFAMALLAMNDPSFAADYGDMARLVAKEYANWDRADTRFPVLRTFDVWRGHGFADGNGFPDGNNQESTSEAVQGWSGLILLGEALGDEAMTATGVMGYTFETRAAMEYWFNAGGDVFPPEWKHPAAGMIWSAGKVWGTWFTGSPSWIYGIQWIPSSPAAAYLARDPQWARQAFQTMLKENDANEAKTAARRPGYQTKPSTIKAFGGELGSYMLGFILLYDPQWAIEQLDALWAEPGDKVVHDPWMANIYFMAHAMRDLGRVDWQCHADQAGAMVFTHGGTSERTFVAWNPTAQPRPVRFFEGARCLGRMTAAPGSITRASRLEPAAN